MSRTLQHQLHSRIEMATVLADLPLTAQQVEHLALELTGPVKAMIAEATATADEIVPVAYAVAEQADPTDRHVTEYAGCRSSIHPEVEEDSPAALLALEMRSTQPDVTATDVPTRTHLTLTVRPQSLYGWTWWRRKLAVGSILRHGSVVTGTGHYGEITVQLRGENVGDLLDNRPRTRPVTRLQNACAGRPAGHPW
ncbi:MULTISPECIES: hypothetical protein [Streptomyces]|uniref:Uncharacterized protein n=1 Tax=Streptomyces europaeiscabiei TaxID=146819 RepID=A0ABU4NR79_9ACTN|nr:MULTISPECIES: hypothetical protein [Streptomyces]MBP5922132.1 hypothetical protein [Streptomyces sp. LBUM 1483]MDX3555235.1 hypothetical protein [Streptomyces europaeiscabiei]MDX3705249.1 hypothetical protein [Streptomyces europaeiscabiei]MDX3864339.1 hypothetical protein [Streptomyces europaeiscabiei]MDX3871579.1 hypothetical protein [Streptomyces europaeiscabiei]